MPRLDGKAFYRRLSETAPTLSRKIVFVTGDVAGTDAERFLEESGCRWLAKPFRLGDLLKAVASTIGCLLCVLWGSGVIRDSGFVATRIPIHTCRISEPPRSVPVGGRRA